MLDKDTAIQIEFSWHTYDKYIPQIADMRAAKLIPGPIKFYSKHREKTILDSHALVEYDRETNILKVLCRTQANILLNTTGAVATVREYFLSKDDLFPTIKTTLLFDFVNWEVIHNFTTGEDCLNWMYRPPNLESPHLIIKDKNGKVLEILTQSNFYKFVYMQQMGNEFIKQDLEQSSEISVKVISDYLGYPMPENYYFTNMNFTPLRGPSIPMECLDSLLKLCLKNINPVDHLLTLIKEK